MSERLGNEGYAFANANAIPSVDKEKRTVAFNIVNPNEKVHPRDLITTLCQAMGIDAARLSKRVSGVDLKPYGVIPGRVIHELLA